MAQTLLEFNFWAPGKQPGLVICGKKLGGSREKPGRRLARANPRSAGRMDTGSGIKTEGAGKGWGSAWRAPRLGWGGAGIGFSLGMEGLSSSGTPGSIHSPLLTFLLSSRSRRAPRATSGPSLLMACLSLSQLQKVGACRVGVGRSNRNRKPLQTSSSPRAPGTQPHPLPFFRRGN